jgi:hypothetical protein
MRSALDRIESAFRTSEGTASSFDGHSGPNISVSRWLSLDRNVPSIKPETRYMMRAWPYHWSYAATAYFQALVQKIVDAPEFLGRISQRSNSLNSTENVDGVTSVMFRWMFSCEAVSYPLPVRAHDVA